jgi:biopolymer transport protein ExbD
MKFETMHKPIRLFNLVSLLNIILLFFSVLMLTTYTLKPNNNFIVQYKSNAKNKQTVSSKTTITLTEHGLIFIDSEEISLPDLSERLKSESKKHNTSMNLVAEKATKVDFIQEVIDIAKSSGIENLAIHTEMVKLNASQ